MTAPFASANKLKAARAFLQEALANGPRPAFDLLEEAAALAISTSTLQRGRVSLKISSKRDRASGVYVWRLRRPRKAITQAPFQPGNSPEDKNHAETRTSPSHAGRLE